MTNITVFTARKVRTMEASMPTAEAVAVRDGKIVEVGSLETMRPWLDNYDHEIDDTFRDHVIMPGFIDPHLHPSMAAILLPMHFTTAVEWDLPWSDIQSVETEVEFLERLVNLDQDLEPGEPLFAYGHHPLWHGDIDRAALNEISSTRPIIAWHRGYHSLIVNDACYEWMELDLEAARRHPQVDVDRGAFYETGLSVAYRQMSGLILGTERFRAGLERMRQVIHHGGQTTIGDAAVGMYGLEQEWDHLVAVMEQPDTPFRMQLMPFAMGGGSSETDEDMLARYLSYPSRNTHRLRFSDHVKMFADGGFFAELLMLKFPGHLDGRHGEWMTPPERFEELARLYWNAGLKIHVHCTGDLGVELTVRTLEKLQAERPRFDHRFTFEHFGISSAQQVDRIAALGGIASVQVYYLYELSRAFADHTLGYERASQMSRLGSLERAGVRFAVHSDFTMAPAKPLNNAWVAANRINQSGEVMCPNERASLDAAIKAITSNAAYVLGLEDEIGSLRWGKQADFTILEDDPYDVGIEGLRDIPIWGTVFEGTKFPHRCRLSNLVPVTVIGGYLGAGKTTLINSLLAGDHGRRLAVLVNDFGSVNIDVDLIVEHEGDTISLANGCLCCSIADSLGESLDHILALETPVDQIVIEASGVADPSKIANYGHGWPGCRLDAVVVLADVETIQERSSDEFVGEIVRRQLASADLIVLTKCDLVDDDQVSDTIDWLATQSQAPLISSDAMTLGQLSAAVVDAHVQAAPRPIPRAPDKSGTGPTEAADIFKTTNITLPTPVQHAQLVEALENWPDEVVRVKGIVALIDEAGTERTALVQRVGRRWSITTVDGAPRSNLNQLVVIALTSSAFVDTIF